MEEDSQQMSGHPALVSVQSSVIESTQAGPIPRHTAGKSLLVTASSPGQLDSTAEYITSPSQTLQSHVPQSEVISPQYIILEDHMALHTYADFSRNICQDFEVPSDKMESAAVTEKEFSSNNFQIYTATSVDSNISSGELKPLVSEMKSLRGDTILTVPVIGKPKIRINIDGSITENAHHSADISTSLPKDADPNKSRVNEHPSNTIFDKPNSFEKNLEVTGDEANVLDSLGLVYQDKNKLSPNSNSPAGPSDAKHGLPESAEASTNTEDELIYPDFDSADNDIAELARKSVDKISQAKAAFSENLGLVPADTEIKILAEKAKYASKGVRTRKSVEICLSALKQTTNETTAESDEEIAKDHTCLKAGLEVLKSPSLQGQKKKPSVYRCGSCTRTFPTICKLHDHLQDHCFGGSYHYDHLLKTAFPKYDTTCCFTQTNFDFDNEPIQKVVHLKKPVVVSAKVRKQKLKLKLPIPQAFLGKRKRGRPKKMDFWTDKIGSKSRKHNIVQVEDFTFENMDDSHQEMDDDFSDMIESSHQAYLPDLKNAENEFNIDRNSSNNSTNFNNQGANFIETKTEDLDRSAEELIKSLDDENLNIPNESNKINVEKDKELVNVANNNKIQEHESEKKKTRKRKMSIPRKVMQNYEEDNEQIVNSRAKPESKIQCEFCSSEFQYTRGLIRHEQEKHADQMKYNCDECDQKFMREYNLERHKLCSHTVGKSKFNQGRKGIYRDKKRKVGKSQDKESGPTVTCDFCSEEVPESRMDLHLRLHTGERPYICHVCGKGLISDKKLKRHLLIHSKTNRYNCEECGQGFSMKYKLRTHMFLHTGHKPYLCSVCGAEFNNSTSLLHHNRTVHLGDKRFECKICGGRYGKKSQLEEHMFRHSDERTQTCRYCGKSFKHAKSLRRHEHTHISDQKFQCDQCDSKFSRKDNLERHKMCHFDATLQCTFCKKKFVERQPLIEHEEFHIKQLKFTCQLCKERFQDEAYFYNHMEKSHGVTQDMVPMVNTCTTSPVKEPKNRRSGGDSGLKNVIFDQLKVPTSYSISESVEISMPQTSTIDTLNLSMSVAGILPATPSSQELRLGNLETIAVDSQSQSLMQHVFNLGSTGLGMNMNVSRHMLNQALNPSYASSSAANLGMNETQRMALNVISGENGTLRIPLEQQAGSMALTADNVLMHDQQQQRMLQDVVGSSMPNMQDQNFRMMY